MEAPQWLRRRNARTLLGCRKLQLPSKPTNLGQPSRLCALLRRSTRTLWQATPQASVASSPKFVTMAVGRLVAPLEYFRLPVSAVPCKCLLFQNHLHPFAKCSVIALVDLAE